MSDYDDDSGSSEKTNIGPGPNAPPRAPAAAPPRKPMNAAAPTRPPSQFVGSANPAPRPRPQASAEAPPERPASASRPAPHVEHPTMRPRGSAPRSIPLEATNGFWPTAPKSLQECGLSATYVEELCLKHLFQAGELPASDMSQRTALPSTIVEEALERLRRSKLCDIKGSGGAGIGRSSMIYVLLEAGQNFTKHAMERDRYVGPAPVKFEQYVEAVKAQTIRGNKLTREDIEPYFKGLVVKDEVYDAIGPAMNSGKALFFYGPPGNGKTAVCSRMTDCFGGDVFVPHALMVDDFVVKVFDDTVHLPIAAQDGDAGYDPRWVKCKRPMVVVGGELMLEQLDLAYSSEVKYYEAPFQMKANCGMLLVDDFGRQKVSPKDLLNRWIVPLESEFDFLSLHTGKKLKVPFDVFVVFSTNLDPAELVDGAFLRRVRYKLEVSRPDEGQFKAIFMGECKKKGIAWDEAMVDYLISTHYKPKSRPFNACEPRDLLGQVVDITAYLGIPAQMTEEILDKVAANYFIRFDQPKKW